MASHLKKLFYPNSICIVGASSKEKSVGYEILRSIKKFGYQGKVYPINPKVKEVLEYKCFSSINEIKEVFDLAILIIPKSLVLETLQELINKNVEAIIVITAGFRESGSKGIELEKKLVELVKNSNSRLVGPNCMGVINTHTDVRLNATFVAEKPETGKVAFLSQSGALGAAVLNSMRETDIRFAQFISVGNKADLNENDFIKYWQQDENIEIITLYLESFENGFEFIKSVINSEISKPVVVLKAGKTKAGSRAASSHTGALSSQDKIVDALLNQFGIIRVENLNDLFNTAKGFEFFPMMKGNKIAVVTNAGGPAILAVDQLECNGLSLSELSGDTKNKLRDIIHPEGSVENPVDLLPGATAEIFKKVNEIVCNDSNVDGIISIFVEPVMVTPFNVVEAVYSIEGEKPVYQVVMPLPEFWNNYKQNSKKKKPVFRNPEDPAVAASKILFFQSAKNRISADRLEYKKLLQRYNVCRILFDAGYLNQIEADRLIRKYNLPGINNTIVKNSDLKNVELDYPVVIKGICDKVIHKSELHGVITNVKNKQELICSAELIESSFRSNGYLLDQFLIQPFIEGEHELLIGGFRDQSFGPVIMFGSGGKYVEVFDDTSIKSAFSSYTDINEMIKSTKIGKILSGVRREKSFDMNRLAVLIRSCALMIIENENMQEFDLNPVILATDNTYNIVDVRIRIT